MYPEMINAKPENAERSTNSRSPDEEAMVAKDDRLAGDSAGTSIKDGTTLNSDSIQVQSVIKQEVSGRAETNGAISIAGDDIPKKEKQK